MKKYLWSLIIFLFFISPVLAGPAQYLNFDPGARPAGMGSAFTAVADDANASLFNPAGLSMMGLNLTEATVSAGFLPLGRSNNFISISQQLPPNDYLNFFLNHFETDNLQGFDASGFPTQGFSDVNLGFGSAYAHDFDYHLKAGIGASLIYENLAGFQTRGFGGLDLGVLYVPSVMEDLVIGASALHLGGFLNAEGGYIQAVAGDCRLGISDRFFKRSLLVAYDVEWQGDTGFTLIHHFGGEFIPWDFLAVRSGLNNFDLTLGGTVKYLNYGLDYSYEFTWNGLGDVQRISAEFFF